MGCKTTVLIATVALWLALAPTARAQYGFTGANSTLLQPSARLAGMGETGVAVFWGGDADGWSNPALTPYRSDLRYERGKSQLVPDLADDVYFRTNRLSWSRWGFGVALAGWPIDATGGDQVDYGVTEVTDADGNLIGRVHTSEDVNSIGVGLSVFELAASAGAYLGHSMPPLSRFGDVSIGHTWKHVTFGETGDPTLFGSAEVNEKDRGYIVRLTPYDAVSFPGLLPAMEQALRFKVEGSYGASEINSHARSMNFPAVNPSDRPVIEDHRQARAFHAELALPLPVEESMRSGRVGWVYDLLSPILSYGVTGERSQIYIRGAETGKEIERNGWEVTVLNVFSVRRGRVEDPNGEVIGDTSGWGVGLSLRGKAGFRYDHAKVPQSTYLEDVKRNAFSLYVDPIQAVRWMH